jgi:hypothetical protein
LLLASINGRQSFSAALELDKREASQPGQTEQGFMVRQLFHLCTELGIDKKNAHE